MKNINFISEQQVERLVENGKVFGNFYEVDIPNQFFTKDTESGKYILHSDTAEFQDFLEKAKKEVFYQKRDLLEADHITDIVCDYSLSTLGFGTLDFLTYRDYFGERGVSQKNVHIIEVYLPQPLKNKGENDEEFQEFIERMTKQVGYEYDINIDTAKVVWKLTEDEYGKKVIEFTIEE